MTDQPPLALPLPLVGICILELAQGIAGPFCGKLLSEFGATVIKVEPLAGDAARQWGPFAHDHPDPEGSLLFLYLNTTKRSITLDLRARTGHRVVDALLQQADVIIADATSIPS